MASAMTLPMPPSRGLPNGIRVIAQDQGPWSGNLAPSATITMPYFLPDGPAPGQHANQMGQIDRNFGHQDIVGSHGDARKAGDPARMPPHRLDDHDAAVAFGRGPQPINGFHHDVDGRVESERKVGHHQVIVDRFGNADDGDPEVIMKADRDSQRIVAADDDQGLQFEPGKLARKAASSVSGLR